MIRAEVRWSVLVALAVAMTVTAVAQTKGIATFGGLKNLEFVADFYNNGKGSMGSGPGPDLGLQFTSNAEAIVQAGKGGTGNFVNDPGNYPVMFFPTGTNVTVNATKGIEVSLWFSYSALKAGTATVYDGPNGTGNILASVTLNPNNSGCSPYAMCVWTPVGIPLSATASSIRFSGTANFVGIASIHLGQLLPTVTTVTSSQDPNQPCASATFTATVLGVGGVVPANTQNGLVTFKAGSAVLAKNVPLTSGTASTTASLPAGTVVTALFKSTPSFNTSHGSLTVQCTP